MQVALLIARTATGRITVSHMPEQEHSTRWLAVTIGAALAFVILAGIAFGWTSASKPTMSSDRAFAELAATSQVIPLQAQMAIRGDATAFDALARSRGSFAQLSSSSAFGVSQAPTRTEMLARTDTVISNRQVVLATHDMAASVKKFVPMLLQNVTNLAGGFGPAKVEAISRQLERIEAAGHRLDQDAAAFATGVGDMSANAQHLGDGIDFISQVLGEFAGQESGLGLPKVVGPDAEQRLRTLTTAFRAVSDKVRATITAAERVEQAQIASASLPAIATVLYATLRQETNADATVSGANGWQTWVPWLLLSLATLSLIVAAITYRSVIRIRQSAARQRAANDRNQEAILRLLDELSNLADGDLTVQATVTEEITGAIADSINYAIEALRELVGTINETSVTLDASTKQTLANAAHVARASVAQSKQAASASESIAAMAASVEEVSGNAERSADVARHSVDIAHKGGDAVRRTIDGMNAIRETIQETSKRIKRLGESSQEIGNIVELINDIAEQTNILALNASIQASMAGEAGRGFAVVADEVQRLAERAANATKQIEVLVRTIQADTNEAVVSMERSTTDVVGGALLAENAGAALEEIEQVSNQIASLVQNISASARHQTTAAQSVSRSMQMLREISAQSASNTSATSHSIGKIAELSAQLRQSVAGFRLPVSGSPAQTSRAAAKTPAPRLQNQAPTETSEDPGVLKVSSLG
jgi:twitching motility protein PilJ